MNRLLYSSLLKPKNHMLRTIFNRIIFLWVSYLFINIPLQAKEYSSENNLVFSKDQYIFKLNPATLEVNLTDKNQHRTIKITNNSKIFDKVASLKTYSNQAKWIYPNLKIYVKVKTDKNGIIFNFRTRKEQNLVWPVAGFASEAEALIIPAGEGLYTPNNDLFWLQEFSLYPEISLSLPFLGIHYNPSYFISYLTPQDNRMLYQIKQKSKKLYISMTHRFLPIDNFSDYIVILHVTPESPLGPALDYRQYLLKQRQLITLKEKIAFNPEIQKLLGAFHVWGWGNGKSVPMLKALQQAGIQHLWIGYTLSLAENFLTKDYVQMAKDLGYLIAPYDSFANAQNKKTADDIRAVWENNLWPNGCIRNQDHSIKTGFAGQGCYLSSQSLRLREIREHNIENRVNFLTKFGNNSYFLDCDASSPLYDDYAADHSMNQEIDKKNRQQRLNYLSNTRKLVVGSESSLSWANSIIAYNNGSFSTFNEVFWPILNDKQKFGVFWPAEKPSIFFKPYQPSRQFVQASYDPKYRIPLYETVFHDSVVSTDRWELHALKMPSLRITKTLLESLYGIPPIWSLDLETFNQNKKYFISYYQFFSPIHKIIGVLPLTEFKWLTKDHLIQQTNFGNVFILTANFSKQNYSDIRAKCIKATWLTKKKISFYCPF